MPQTSNTEIAVPLSIPNYAGLCLFPLQVSEVHPGWMVSRACLGCQEDPGILDSKESLEDSAFQDQRAQLGCQVAKVHLLLGRSFPRG